MGTWLKMAHLLPMVVGQCMRPSKAVLGELVAVSRVLESVTSKLCGHRGYAGLQIILTLCAYWGLVAENHICREKCLECLVPREENMVADTISRIVDYDDCYLDPAIFHWLYCAWGPHEVDRFANNYNTQLTKFNSRYACPKSEAINEFTVNWNCENNWLCPPPCMVAWVLRHAELCGAEGTLIILW